LFRYADAHAPERVRFCQESRMQVLVSYDAGYAHIQRMATATVTSIGIGTVASINGFDR